MILTTLELLSRLPEELNVRISRSSETDIDVYVGEMRKHGALLFQFLDYCSQQAQQQSSNSVSNQILRQVYYCVDSYVYFLGVDQTVLNQTSMLAKLFQTVSTSSGYLYESAVDTLITIIRCMDVNLEREVNFVAASSVLGAGIQLANHFDPDNLDEEIVRGHVRIFCEMGESMCPLFARNIQNAEMRTNLDTLLAILLKCMDLDAEVAVLTLTFWFKFVDDVLNYNYNFVDVYMSQLNDLIGKCVVLLKYPDDIGNVHEFLEENDNFEGNRSAILDLLEDICRLIGKYD